MKSYLWGLLLVLAALAIGAALAGVWLSGPPLSQWVSLPAVLCMGLLLAAALTLLNR